MPPNPSSVNFSFCLFYNNYLATKLNDERLIINTQLPVTLNDKNQEITYTSGNEDVMFPERKVSIIWIKRVFG